MKKIILIGISFLFLSGCLESMKPEEKKEITTKARKISLAADKVQEDAEQIIVAIEDAETDDILELLQIGVGASAPFNPYAVPISAGLGVLSAALALLNKKKTTEIKKAASNLRITGAISERRKADADKYYKGLRQVVRGIEQIEKTDELKLKQTISQDDQTQELVTFIRKELKA